MFPAAMCPSSGELFYQCYTWFLSLWYAGYYQSNLHTRRSSTLSDINQVSHWYNNSTDNGHMAARNMYGIEINIHKKKLCAKLVIYKNHARMHRQQNIKYYFVSCHMPFLPGTSSVQPTLIPDARASSFSLQDVPYYTGCFTTLGHNCRRWFPRSLWSKKFI